MHRSVMSLIALAIFLFPDIVEAQIYTWKDPNGGIHYSNTAHDGAARVLLKSPNVIHDSNLDFRLKNKHIPFRNIGSQIHVQGQVNGVPVDFIVDTGSSYIVIPDAVARRADISTVNAPTIQLQTANGITNARLVKIGQFTLGSLHAENIDAMVHNIDSHGSFGLLGMDFLGGYKMTIDRVHSMLVLDPR